MLRRYTQRPESLRADDLGPNGASRRIRRFGRFRASAETVKYGVTGLKLTFIGQNPAFQYPRPILSMVVTLWEPPADPTISSLRVAIMTHFEPASQTGVPQPRTRLSCPQQEPSFARKGERGNNSTRVYRCDSAFPRHSQARHVVPWYSMGCWRQASIQRYHSLQLPHLLEQMRG